MFPTSFTSRFLLLFLLIFQSLAFGERLDSLKTVLNKTSESDEKARLNFLIAEVFHAASNPDSASFYNVIAEKYALESKKTERLLSKIHYLNTLTYYRKLDLPKAIKYALKCQEYAAKTSSDTLLARAHNILGVVYAEAGEREKSRVNFETAAAVSKKAGLKKMEAVLESNLGNIYSSMEDYANSIRHYQRAIEVWTAVQDSGEIARTYTNLSLAQLYNNQFGDALNTGYQALAIYNRKKEISPICHGQIGQCLFMIMKSGKNEYLPDSLKGLSREALLNKARQYFLTAIKMAEETERIGEMRKLSKVISDAEEEAGRYQEALKWYRYYVEFNDSIEGGEVKAEIARNEMRLEMEKQEALNQAELKRQETIKYASYVAIALLLMLALIALNGYLRKRRDNRIIAAEKNKSEQLLLNILPAEIADELKQKGKAEARLYEHTTVLFTDFANFTKVSESMNPQDLVSELHRCFSEFDRIIRKHGLEKIKTIGDAYLAVSGLPIRSEDHALRAVAAALEIRDWVNRQTLPFTAGIGGIRIGIHSGPVVAGIVGVDKYSFDIWGDTVNTASRIESSGLNGEVNISVDTKVLIEEAYVCESRGLISAKNKAPMEMFLVKDKRK